MEELDSLEVLEDPSSIFNCDETDIRLCPTSGKVLSFRGERNVYEICPGPEKSNITFLGTFRAGCGFTKQLIDQ